MTDTNGLVITHRLPLGLTFTYYAEGAANVVYKIEIDAGQRRNLADEIPPSEIESSAVSSPSSSPTELEDWQVHVADAIGQVDLRFKGKLLRLRKDRAYSASPLQSQQDFESLIKPLFRLEDLVQSAVVEIDEALIVHLNADLKNLEHSGIRPHLRHGVYLRNERYATIVDDIGYGLESTDKVFELKPKWLLQSPDAPEHARRCRTCALRLLRHAKQPSAETKDLIRALTPLRDGVCSGKPPQIHKHGPSRRSGFCPLDLTSRSPSRVLDATKQYIEDGNFSNEQIDHIAKYLTTSTLLQKLKRLQATLYPHKIIETDANNLNFLTLMTLRDCSLFLVISSRGVVDARLGDLDLKSPTRIEHWKDIERQLVDGGWYETSCEEEERDHVKCALEA